MCVHVCVCISVCMCVCMRMHVCVCACVCVYACVCASKKECSACMRNRRKDIARVIVTTSISGSEGSARTQVTYGSRTAVV